MKTKKENHEKLPEGVRPDKKQFIIIMTDTQRKDMIDAYKDNGSLTPNLDKLCKNGIMFEKGYCVQPVCGPSRSALFSGLYPHTNGCIANSVAYAKNVRSIGKRLSDKGIPCGYIGKYHLDGGDYFGLGRADEGYLEKYWYDMRNYLEELTQEERLFSRKVPPTENSGIDDSFTYGNRCSNRAVDFLNEYKGGDFFLTVSYDEPHHPYVTPERFLNKFKDYRFPKTPNIWDNLENKPEHHKVWARVNGNKDPDTLELKFPQVFANNSYIDHEIGRVLECAYKLCPDATILYTSDHGTLLNSHRLNDKGAAMYEEITNTPFIWYNRSLPHAKCSIPVSHVDVVPTVLKYFDAPVSRCIEGEDISDIILNPAANHKRNIFMEYTRYETDHDGFMGYQPIRAVTDGEFKLVINLMTSDELYDLKNDPYEMDNKIENPDYFETRQRLFDSLIDNMNNTRDPFRGYYWEERAWHKSKNVCFGYTKKTRQREDLEYEPRQLDYDTGLEISELVRSK